MRMRLTSLLAAALLAGTCGLALAQGAGGASGGGGATGAGSDIATPRANPGPGGTAGARGNGMTTRMVHHRRGHHRHYRHHRRHHRM